ncbi:type II secretion system protein [Paenibacillus sp. FSL H3-0333]|uniref:type II secretion system protein n=1 Tax=Paenibacillus sp. FSL H3-0333 TaxID=2921373 RepID=UPI0030F81129
MLAEAIRKKLGKAVKEEKGFTLIELLAVIVILGIIAVIAIPMIGNVIDNSKKDSDVATARQVYDAARLYVIGEKGGGFKETNGLTINIGPKTTEGTLQNMGYLESPMYLPSTKEEITGGTVTFNSSGELTGVTLTPKSSAASNSTSGLFSPEQILKATRK